MEPFIPNDKNDIAGLKNCWHYAYQNIDSIDLVYLGQLARKTYELFLCYNDDVIPKSIIDLTSPIWERIKNGCMMKVFLVLLITLSSTI